ncbi:MAG: rod shape-determining protein MreC [Patescibacteria group bacterium]
MKRNLAPVVATLFLFVAALAVAEFSTPVREYLAAGTRTTLHAPLALLGFGRSSETEQLLRENARLKAEVLFLAKEPRNTGTVARPEVSAKVHSTYPTNSRGLLNINAGSSEGIKKGMTVTVDGFTFLGVVEEVGERSSIVRTIFDTDWQIPVKIGDGAHDALMVGGRGPRLTLIVKTGNVLDGDDVYTASKEFPYGLRIGEVKEVKGEPGSTFEEADIKLPFDATLDEVHILL